MVVATEKRKPGRRKGKPKAKSHWSPDEIRALRERLGLSHEAAGARIGVSARAFYSWELASQERAPSKAHVILLNLLADGTI